MKSKRSKATDISQSVKQRVRERDGNKCIICIYGTNPAPNAHYIPRSAGGLGIEENIVTLCAKCHREYDQSVERDMIAKRIESYLKRKYPNWDKQNLIYKK